MHIRIKRIRSKVNVTQEEFANHLQISPSYYNKIENGKISISERLIKKICTIFKINKKWIYTGDGTMFSTGNNSDISHLKSIIIKLIWSIDDNILEKYFEHILVMFTALSDDLSIDNIYKSIMVSLYRNELEAEKRGTM